MFNNLYTVEFTAANTQLDWLEISLFFDESDKHSTICDSYNAEVASTLVQTVSIETVENTYSVTNELTYNIKSFNGRKRQKNVLYETVCRVKL